MTIHSNVNRFKTTGYLIGFMGGLIHVFNVQQQYKFTVICILASKVGQSTISSTQRMI